MNQLRGAYQLSCAEFLQQAPALPVQLPPVRMALLQPPLQPAHLLLCGLLPGKK